MKIEEGFLWQAASPESEGMSSSCLDVLRDILAARGSKTFLVIRHDRIVYEWYGSGFGPRTRHFTASLDKALLGGISLLLALGDGRLALDDPACKYIPAWRKDPKKSRITIRHLATHSSGIEDAKTDGLSYSQLSGWIGAFWRGIPDPFTVARDEAPVVFSPGSKFAYSNPGMAMLAYAVTASLRDAPQSDIKTLLHQRIMRPIGIEDEEWKIAKPSRLDGLTLYPIWGGAEFTARATARLGRLMLRKSNWEGPHLIPKIWVERAVIYSGTPLPVRSLHNPLPGSGLCWWTNFDRVWASVPRDAFAGYGAQDQVLLVVPNLDLIVVRNGESFSGKKVGLFWGGVEKYLFNPLMEAINEY